MTELIKHNSGIKRLADKAWLRVSAPQGLAAEAPGHVWLALQDVIRLRDDPETAALVTELIKHGSGIARLADKAWMAVSAPQRLAAEAPRHVWLALQDVIRLLDDVTMNFIVKRILKRDSGLKRLDEDFVKVRCGVRVRIVRVPILRDAAGVCMSSCSCCCRSSRGSPST